MKKSPFSVVACLVCFCPIFFGLGVSAAETVTVTDQAGRTVSVAQPVNRVATTFIPATLFALSADLSEALVGASNKDGTGSVYEALTDPDHPPVLVGNRSSGLNLETIFSLKPDLVIMYGQKDGIRMADHITAMGIPAIVIMPESMPAVREALELIGRASGRTSHVNEVLKAMAAMEQRITDRLGDVPPKKVYYTSSRLLTTISGDMLQNEMIKMAGGINVSENTHGFFVTVSREQLLSWNPEVILASDRLAEDEKERLFTPAYSSVRAVRDHTIFKVPAETYWDFPSPLAMAGVAWMAGRIHPDVFPGKEIRSEISRLYDTLFGPGFSRAHPRVVGNTEKP